LRSLRGRGGRKAVDDNHMRYFLQVLPQRSSVSVSQHQGDTDRPPRSSPPRQSHAPNPIAQTPLVPHLWVASLLLMNLSVVVQYPQRLVFVSAPPGLWGEGNCKRTNNILKNRFHLHTSPARKRRRYTYPRCRSGGDGESALAGRVVGSDLQGGD
jgi:hypothetical protein